MTRFAGEVDGVRPPDRVPGLPAAGDERGRPPRRGRATQPSPPRRKQDERPENDGGGPPDEGEKGSHVDIRAQGASRSFCTLSERRGGKSCRLQWLVPRRASEFTSVDAGR
ncbi:MAG TPA: hypothetical protein VMW35_07980 [Myxococcota bacterium]|nr:hypothetical protein [Myxococcota bacterium]